LVEIKYPYKYREFFPEDATQTHSDGTTTPKLKQNYTYYCHVQGQLAITERKWYDCYTTKGVSVERILYDAEFRENKLLLKLITFYDKCLCPSVVS